ncbi:Glutathione S-transferase C-terminal-like, partial [Trinorchestia longiramus]
MVTFGNLKQSAGVKALNDFLSDRSYIEGYSASQSDVAVFEALGSAPAASYPHALRWYHQLASYGSDKTSLPGVKPVLESSAAPPAAAAAAPAEEEDDDDVDLFGSDDDE